MILFKNRADTMQGVLQEAKHAFDGKPRDVSPGEIILIAQTKSTLLPNQKPIRYIMNFVSCEEDINNETDKIWGRHWRYIVTGENVREIEPFDIDEIKQSSKDYSAVQTHCKVDPLDEEIVLNWISEPLDYKPSTKELASFEFKKTGILKPDEIIKEMDTRYSNKPAFREIISRLVKRPSGLSNAIKEKHGYRCAICGYPGFEKKGGGKYAEVHHMIELNENAPKTLQSWNLLVVCPLCHKKLHYGNVKTKFLNPGWKIFVEGKEIVV